MTSKQMFKKQRKQQFNQEDTHRNKCLQPTEFDQCSVTVTNRILPTQYWEDQRFDVS